MDSLDFCMCCMGPLDDPNKEYCHQCTRELYLDTGDMYWVATFHETCWELPVLFGLVAMRPEVDDIPF